MSACRAPAASSASNPTLRFDLDNDSYASASKAGSPVGRTSFTSFSEQGDFTVQFEGGSSWRGSTISVQAGPRSNEGTPDKTTYTGTNDTVLLPGGVGSGTSYDFAFRAFAQPAANAYQMFIDMTAIPKLYGSADPASVYNLFFPNKAGVGTIGDRVTVSLNGLGSNNVVFDANLTLPPVDLDVDSDNADTVPDPANDPVDRSAAEEAIEADSTMPGVIVPVGGDRAKMVVDVPKGITATLAFDAAAAAKVKVFAASGAVVLEQGRLSTSVGMATFAIAGNRIAPVARLSVTADQKTIRGFLSGGELRVSVELLDTNNQPAGDRIINLDDRWWFSTRSETIRVRATVRRQDGTPAGAGVPVKFHDTKRLLDDAAVLTNQAGQAVADLFVPNDRAVWSILGRNVVTASAAGYSAQELTRIDGRNGAALRPPVELEFSTAVLAGDKTQDGTLPLADPTALSRLGAEVDVPFAAKSTITLRNLAPGEPYRLEVPDNAPVVLRVPGSAPASQVRFVAPPSNGTNVSTFQIQVESKGGMTGTRVEVVKPLLYLEATWWNWFQDPVGYSVKGDTAGTIIVGPASAAARIGQITQSIAGGALFGAGGLDASLAGDIGLSMIPGIGVVADVRDVGKSLLKLVPIDLGLGPFDWREAAIAGFGILTEIVPPADAIVDVYRSMYKIAKQVPAVMPVFLSIEPLFTKALTSLFDFTPFTASAALTASGNFASVAARASSTSFGADDIFRFLEGVPGIGKHNARRLLAHTEIGKVLKADAVFQGKYADLVRLGGTKFGDDLETIFQAFGKDALVRMVKHGTGSLEDFGAGFNAMATALRRHSADGTWQNTALLDSLKASPEAAAEIFTNIGTTSRRVQEASIRFKSGIAGESDVSQAIALVIGRAAGSAGHSFVSTIDQLRHFSDDLMTLTDVSRSVDQMRSAVALIRRFRSDKAYLPTQAGRLFELQEVAAALRDNSDTVLSFNNFRKGPGGRTDIDILLNGKAIELKLTLNRVTDQDIITKFFKYHAAVGPGKPLELRSLDDVSTMQAFVKGAFKTYLDMPDTTKWPVWLKGLAANGDKKMLADVRNAITYFQVQAPRYNFVAAAG